MIRKLSAIILLFMLVGCSFPDEQISADTKDIACEQNLMGALSAFSSDLGLPIQISNEDAISIFEDGEVSKYYGRDGYKYTVTFGLETKEDGCNLVFYKQEKVGPVINPLQKAIMALCF